MNKTERLLRDSSGPEGARVSDQVTEKIDVFGPPNTLLQTSAHIRLEQEASATWIKSASG